VEKKYTLVDSSNLLFCNPLIGEDETDLRFDSGWYLEGGEEYFRTIAAFAKNG
jgi:hypothetical protein